MEPQTKEKSLQLNDKEAEVLRTILHKLRRERSIKFVELAKELKCDPNDIWAITGRRKRGTQEFFEQVQNFCRLKRIEFPNISHLSRMDMLLSQMEIDEYTIEQSKDYAGKYKLFSFIARDCIGVTWVELDKKPRIFSVPQFRTWRPSSGSGPVVVAGLYYGVDNTLFMAGNKVETPFSRCIITSPMEYTEDRVGYISGASSSEYLFHSFCLLKKIPDDKLRKESRAELGEFSWRTFIKKYPNESNIMEENKSSFHSHRKPSGN